MQSEKSILEQVSATMKTKGYDRKTRKTYIKWINKYILFYAKRDLMNMGVAEIEKFKNNLDTNVIFAFELKKQAFQAITFLYTQVFGISLQNQYIEVAKNLNKSHKIKQTVMVF